MSALDNQQALISRQLAKLRECKDAGLHKKADEAAAELGTMLDRLTALHREEWQKQRIDNADIPNGVSHAEKHPVRQQEPSEPQP